MRLKAWRKGLCTAPRKSGGWNDRKEPANQPSLRAVAEVFRGGENLNLAMVLQGAAFANFLEPLQQKGAPGRGAFTPVAAIVSSHQEQPIGCLWFTHGLSGAWQERDWDHVSGKRCSGLDLLGCDPGPGYAARDFKTRESVVAYGLSHRRDGVRAAPSSSPVVCRIVGAPPLCAPARMITGRTLWEEEVRVGSRASPSSSNYAFLPVVEGFGGSSFRTERGLLPPF
jgi:hypothetical protein